MNCASAYSLNVCKYLSHHKSDFLYHCMNVSLLRVEYPVKCFFNSPNIQDPLSRSIKVSFKSRYDLLWKITTFKFVEMLLWCCLNSICSWSAVHKNDAMHVITEYPHHLHADVCRMLSWILPQCWFCFCLWLNYEAIFHFLWQSSVSPVYHVK